VVRFASGAISFHNVIALQPGLFHNGAIIQVFFTPIVEVSMLKRPFQIYHNCKDNTRGSGSARAFVTFDVLG
jgi:hypothetical protein